MRNFFTDVLSAIGSLMLLILLPIVYFAGMAIVAIAADPKWVLAYGAATVVLGLVAIAIYTAVEDSEWMVQRRIRRERWQR